MRQMKKIFLLLFFSALVLFLTINVVFAVSKKCLLTPNKPYKYKSNAAVYLVTSQCTKQAFSNPTVYFEYFKSWKQVKVTTKKILAKIPDDKNWFVQSKNKIIIEPSNPSKEIIPALSGCAYNKPSCAKDYFCKNNICEKKEGCLYSNPICEAGYNCIDNQCKWAFIGCQWNNPTCNINFQCINNKCVSASQQTNQQGCAYYNPACQGGHLCVSNLCTLKSQSTPADYIWEGPTDNCGNGICEEGKNLSCPIDCDPPNVYSSISEGPFIVKVPKGFEELGSAYLEDLKNCVPLLKNFLGITPLLYNKIFLRMSIGDVTSGSSNGRGIFYQKTIENAQSDLQELHNNNKDGFFYKSSATYCANTHELTHIFTSSSLLPIPPMLFEGIAEYAQKNVQSGSKDYLECKDNGIYRQDLWGDNKYKIFPYIPLGGNRNFLDDAQGSIWYGSGMCFWEYINTKYGHEKFKEVIQLYRKVTDLSNQPISKLQVRRFLFDKVLIPVLGNQIEDEIKQRFGFDDSG
ncbi:MAG TPA: hypothetical protein DEB73_00645 [Candidatus Magasanikbacteria bacterium]|uniref:Uncharacterized protein n=1 Tax=Candidatus Magasanikbacteria bacterium GW2011_GWA2_41_55 TaxID=1619038 RepID=A0A0G0WKX2_9BACT|nr:MAG: hypothetical protein UU69_C0004G0011 [Candidatus Magasanikbacteria bacterium GW2011_GWA2_41_55]HBV57770.1 hypothetical protein [Candidatus Magasanikbacteria bacterium]